MKRFIHIRLISGNEYLVDSINAEIENKAIIIKQIKIANPWGAFLTGTKISMYGLTSSNIINESDKLEDFILDLL